MRNKVSFIIPYLLFLIFLSLILLLYLYSMRKISVYMHVSLDGFVAGPGGEMDWIKVDAELFDYGAKFIDNADTYLLGRVTYQMMEAYWPTAGDQPDASKHDIHHSKWYNQVPKVILSKSLAGQTLPNATIISSNIKEQVQQLKNQPGKGIIIFGSPSTAHALMQEDLIDEYGLFVNPIVLGKGIPMFSIDHQQKLSLFTTQPFSSGVVFMQYKRN
jgi:dihydrofolate reductase